MNEIVKLVHKISGNKKELTFSHAQEFLRIDNSYKCAKDSNYQFINNELIKQPGTKSSKKPTKKGGDTTGGEVPK